MALGDGIRRNIAQVEPTERTALRDAIIEMHHRFYPGSRDDTPPGGVSWWFKQDEIHQATHVHGGPEFLPWHREITNRFEAMLREINPQLSLHYWDFKEDRARSRTRTSVAETLERSTCSTLTPTLTSWGRWVPQIPASPTKPGRLASPGRPQVSTIRRPARPVTPWPEKTANSQQIHHGLSTGHTTILGRRRHR